MRIELVNKIADELCGTCNDLERLLEEYDIEFTTEEYQELDNITFLCESCGWWCEAGDWIDDPDRMICTDCGE